MMFFGNRPGLSFWVGFISRFIAGTRKLDDDMAVACVPASLCRVSRGRWRNGGAMCTSLSLFIPCLVSDPAWTPFVVFSLPCFIASGALCANKVKVCAESFTRYWE